jgi:ribosomal protein S27AE
MSAFTQHPRDWCPDCGCRVLAASIKDRGVCLDCYWKAMEQAEKDAENRSWRGFSADERALNG